MGTFDSHVDTPDQIRKEGEELTIKFERTGSTTGRISWVIPPPAQGCSADQRAYCGILIVLNTVANKPANWPENGKTYVADPTGNPDLHAGDKINGALVVGAFYNDRETTSLDVTDLEPDAAYFITGHVVDCVHRYHRKGVSTYSLPYLYTEPTDDTCAYQEITLGGSVSESDNTGLDVNTSYTVNIQINFVDYTLTVNGADAQTYGELVDELNKQIKLVGNPYQGPQGPNAGAYYYNSEDKNLFQWDGANHNEIPVVVVEATDPTSVENNEYWLDGNGILRRRTSSPPSWNVVNPYIVGFDPVNPTSDSYWAELVDSPATVAQVWSWHGSAWCQRPTFVQENDPSCPPNLTSGSYWYDENSEMLKAWSETLEAWVDIEAIVWGSNPHTLSDNTFWFDDVEEILYERVGGSWIQRTVIISNVAPTHPILNTYWFNPEEQELMQYTGSPLWTSIDVIVWGSDPTEPTSCELWWNISASPQRLNIWDAVNAQWVLVNEFFISDIDPSLPASLAVGTIWVDGNKYWEWDGSQFTLIPIFNVVEWPSDPTDVLGDSVWYDSFTETYYQRSGNQWIEIDVIESENDPTQLPAGTFWFNTTTNTLNMWNGISWINVMYSTTPLYPVNGSLWYDTSTDTLKAWNAVLKVWEVAKPLAVVTFNDPKGCEPEGNIIFTSTLCGSNGNILVGKVEPTGIMTFSGYTYDFTGTLFPALSVQAQLKPNVAGGDGLSGTPSYQEIGVGDNGDDGPRRELAESIRRQLGYPTIQVELTKEQLNEAINSALEELRERSASAYRRVYFFLDVKRGIQKYLMTNERVGFNKIVNVMGAWRINSAFMSSAYAAGVYGQTMIQHLYHMGTFDLVSYHLISDYIEQLEQLFATRITYTWDEGSRELYMFQHFANDERILLDCVIERTEQELLVSRWTKTWIERWAMARARLMLAEIRGKYASLPGAGGGVSLNASDLISRAEADMQICIEDIDNFIVNDVENLGIGSEFIIG